MCQVVSIRRVHSHEEEYISRAGDKLMYFAKFTKKNYEFKL